MFVIQRERRTATFRTRQITPFALLALIQTGGTAGDKSKVTDRIAVRRFRLAKELLFLGREKEAEFKFGLEGG
jgi:hypothetical protein